jgi:hypothetical protein
MFKRPLSLLLSFVFLLILLAAVVIYRFQASRQIAGVIRDAETHAPLEGVTVALGNAQTTTNDHGEYALGLPLGNFQLTVTYDGYLVAGQAVNGWNQVATRADLDLELVPNYVMGYVLDAETNQALGKAALQFGNRALTANAQGAFELRGVKEGTPVTVLVPGYQPAALAYAGEYPFNIPLAPTQVTVTVFDPNGRPIPNAQIQADNQSGVSDAQGRAVLRRVKTGTTIRSTAPGFAMGSEGFAGNDIRMTLRPNAFDGIVLDVKTGRPISGTLVYLGNTIAKSNPQGAFHLDNLPEKGTLTLMAPGYRKTQIDLTAVGGREIKLEPFLVKGIHIPFGSTPDQLKVNMDLVLKSELNAIVIDVKAEKGRVSWQSQVPLAKEVGASMANSTNLHDVVAWCQTNHIYCIARLPVFQDTLLATTRPDLGLRLPTGKIYTDRNGTGWTNAANPTVWDYNIALAKEAAAFGFDEIQFDYVRFPGQVSGLYTGPIETEDGRVAAIAGFLARAQKELRPAGVFISADVFGLTTATNDDQYTGQRLRDLGPYLDYVSPMVYPDVWASASYLLSNGLKISNCGEAVRCPYDVIYNSYKRSTEKTSAKVRLWLQAYAGRGNFGVAEYKIQKKAAEEAGSIGWMFWSGAGHYDAKTFNAK